MIWVVLMSRPSRWGTPSTTTSSGTTTIPAASTSPTGREAVESVTTATEAMSGRYHVDQAGGSHDDHAHRSAVEGALHLHAVQRQGLQGRVVDVRGDLDPIADLALDLEHAGDSL